MALQKAKCEARCTWSRVSLVRFDLVTRFSTTLGRLRRRHTIAYWAGFCGLILLVCAGVATGEQLKLSTTGVASLECKASSLEETAVGKCVRDAIDKQPEGDRWVTTELIAQNLGLQQSALNNATREKSDVPAPPDTSVAGTKIRTTDPTSPPDPNAYVIGEQDTLMITVWKEKEISGPVVVRPDGKITVPLVGEVSVVGMTPVQVQAVLSDKLKPFVTIPQVSVAVTDIRSRRVYLIGRAAREGSFTINSTSTVLQIIAQAGGLKDYAKRKKIYILRQQGSEQLHLPFNYEDVIRGKNPDQNILLQPGDTIVVP